MTPSAVVRLAIAMKMGALAITDHDTVGGIREAESAAIGRLVVVPAIELSSSLDGDDIHILGYFIEPGSHLLLERLAALQHSRQERVRRITDQLCRMGYWIDFKRVSELSRGDSPGRLHVARALQEAGFVASIEEAFERFLGRGRPAYIERRRLSPTEAVALIREAGGVSVLAHPGRIRAEMMVQLLELDLAGLEVYHPDHDRGTAGALEELCRRHDLISTGGSDFHSQGLGICTVSLTIIDRLYQARPVRA
ncbi:MAG: PHP domain-containing protein [Firmicutes bacterium]|nr:PHP domain-containing protein [Bacillota bacterium]